MGSGRLRSLRVQILLWTILPAVLLVIALLLSGVSEHRRTMRAMVAERDAELVQALADGLSSQLRGYTGALELLAASPAAAAAAVEQAPAYLPGLELALVGVDGTAPAPLPVWAEVLAREQPADGRAPRVLPGADGALVTWALPLAGDGGRLLAALPVAALELPRRLNVRHLGAGGAVLLTTGEVILFAAGPAREDRLDGWPGTEAALAGESGVAYGQGPEGEEVVAYAPVAGPGWTLAIREPWQPLVLPLLRVDRMMPVILLIAGASSLLTLSFGIHYLVRPLQRLGERATRIGAGDFEAAGSSVGGVDEIEQLRRTLDSVARQVQRYQAALEEYLAALTSAQEEERARLARDLHDETVQSLVALGQRVQMAQRALGRSPEEAGERLQEVRAMVAQTLEEVRRLSQALRPLYLEELGLVPALEVLAREAGAGFGVTGEPRRLGHDKELALYRVAQEALSNARRHAHANHVRLSLSFGAEEVALSVRDDGAGFVPPRRLGDMGRSGHFGLMGMYERAHLAGGDFEVRSAPGEGTTIAARFPYIASCEDAHAKTPSRKEE